MIRRRSGNLFVRSGEPEARIQSKGYRRIRVIRGMHLFGPLPVMLAIGFALNGCGAARQPTNSSMLLDLGERFSLLPAGNIASLQNQSFTRHYPVMRRGTSLDCLVVVAPATIRASLSGLAGKMILKCVATPVFNLGDGFRMDVIIATGAFEGVVYERYFDPGRKNEDRNWIPLAIAFEAPGTKDAELRIRVTAGPQGDLVDDWLALHGLRLDRQEAGQ